MVTANSDFRYSLFAMGKFGSIKEREKKIGLIEIDGILIY